MRDPAQIEALVAEAVERFGGLDIVVANAGVGAYGDFLDLDPEHLEEMIDINVKGLLYTVRAGLPHLLESDSRRPRGGRVDRRPARARGRGGLRRVEVRAGRVHALARPRAVPPRRALLDDRARAASHTEFAMGRGRTPEDPDLAGMMRPEEVADAVVHAVTRPRTHRVLEATILPMSDDSMN